MATLGNRKTIRVVLPGSTELNPGEECWADCYDEPIVADLISDDMKNPELVTISALSKLIKDWCFVDDKGVKLPVNAENIKLLPLIDMATISEATRLEERMNAKALTPGKKNS